MHRKGWRRPDGGCPSGRGRQSLRRVGGIPTRFAITHCRESETPMQAFLFNEYSLRPVDLLPPEEPDVDDGWRQSYEAEVRQVQRLRVLECVLSDLDGEESPLLEWIDDAIVTPHEPGRAKANLMELANLGQTLLNLVAEHVDKQANLRLNGGAR